jgi:tungstate transport system ATP-binding protein
MAFILRPSQGKILFDGLPAAPFDDSVRFQVTLLTQEPYLMKRSVYKNIVYGLKVRGEHGNWMDQVKGALIMVGLDPGSFLHRSWDELSGGEAQRVALAARLVLKPRVLLLDEPTASVDLASSELIRNASLRARKEWGTTLVISSHDRSWLHDVCDDVVHLFKGKLSGSGRSNMIFGPWIKRNAGLYVKSMGNDDYLEVSAPPSEDATAFIDPSEIRIVSDTEHPETEGVATIQGAVTRLVLDRPNGVLFADVRIGLFSLVVQIDESRLGLMTLHRGWPVTLAYRIEQYYLAINIEKKGEPCH